MYWLHLEHCINPLLSSHYPYSAQRLNNEFAKFLFLGLDELKCERLASYLSLDK
jgi:hypothetical protein